MINIPNIPNGGLVYTPRNGGGIIGFLNPDKIKQLEMINAVLDEINSQNIQNEALSYSLKTGFIWKYKPSSDEYNAVHYAVHTVSTTFKKRLKKKQISFG